MTDIEDRLTHSLQARADAVPVISTAPASVTDRARRMRRQRHRWVAAGAAAAILVVAIGTAATQRATSPDGLPAIATPTRPVVPSSPMETATATPLPEAPVTYPVGPAPRIGLLVDGVYTPPSGEPAYPLPAVPGQGHITAITRFDGGLLASDDRYFEGTNGLSLVTVDHTTEIEPCTSGTGISSADRALAAWATSMCPESGVVAPAIVHLREADGTIRSQVVSTPANTSALLEAAGILRGQVVVNRVFDQGAFITDLNSPPRTIPGVVGVAAVNEAEGTVAAALSTGGSGVLDPLTGDLSFTITDRRFLGAFSPDGAMVLAQGSGNANCTALWFLEAETGQERGSFVGPAGFCTDQVVWEDDNHVLMNMSSKSQTVILRIGLDGDVEQAGGGYSTRISLVP